METYCSIDIYSDLVVAMATKAVKTRDRRKGQKAAECNLFDNVWQIPFQYKIVQQYLFCSFVFEATAQRWDNSL